MRLNILLVAAASLGWAKHDYYATLRVSRTASNEEVRDEWKKLLGKYLPGRGDAQVNRRLEEYAEAWEVLGNEKHRKKYDKRGHEAWIGRFQPGKISVDDLMKRDAKDEDNVVIGIDLGTQFSSVGVYNKENEIVNIIPNTEGMTKIPSSVAFLESGKVVVGKEAFDHKNINPENAVFNTKALIGRYFGDSSIQENIKILPFKVVENKNGANLKPFVEVTTAEGTKTLTPEEISAIILVKLREIAETYLKQKVHKAVITVPACFNNAQRKATMDAGAIAGLQVLRIINEPTAVAIAYGQSADDDMNVIVFHIGAGFFDVSLIAIDDGSVEVLASDGDMNLGGNEFTRGLANYMTKLYLEKTGHNIAGNLEAVQVLQALSEEAKIVLSTKQEAEINVDFFSNGNSFKQTITRSLFEDLNEKLFSKIITSLEDTIQRADLTKKDISKVVLVGGSTEIPKIQELVEKFFNGREISTRMHMTTPAAYGAAMQGGLLAGAIRSKDLLVIDKSSYTIGNEIMDGKMTTIVPKNSAIPTKTTKQFHTPGLTQMEVPLLVFEGEDTETKNNYKLSKFTMHVPPEVSKIEAKFDIDANGILNMTAQEQTDLEHKIVVPVTGDGINFSEEDLNIIIEEFKESANNKMQLELIENARGSLDLYIQSVIKTLGEELAGKISKEGFEKLSRELSQKREWLEESLEAEPSELIAMEVELDEIVQSILVNIGNKDEL